jgi:hypothetical protein
VWPVVESPRAFFTSEGVFTFAYLAVFRNPIYLEGLINAFLRRCEHDPRDYLGTSARLLMIVSAFPERAFFRIFSC